MNDQAEPSTLSSSYVQLQTLGGGSHRLGEHDTQNSRAVPGHPNVLLEDQYGVKELLQLELSTSRLARFSEMLFLTSRPENISPLHHQRIKGRCVCITERPDLHLIWYYDQIFIKPMPKFLLSEEFWDKHIHGNESDNNIKLEAVGFMRTYACLILHESDLDIAKDLRLMPKSLSWYAWNQLIQGFKYRRDDEVTKRYYFGEIRLTRLNACSILLEGESYLEMSHNYITFFSNFASLSVFVFSAATVLLTGLQTGLANFSYGSYYSDLTARVVPFTIVLTLMGVAFSPVLLTFFWMKEIYLYLRHKDKSPSCSN